MGDPTDVELRARLESLPQELYDEIWKLTFTAKPGTRTIDTKSGRTVHRAHLKFLQIDPASRAQYAKSYYSDGAGFRLLFRSMRSWLESLSATHKALIRDVECICCICGEPAAALESRDKRRTIWNWADGDHFRKVSRIRWFKCEGESHSEAMDRYIAGKVPESKLVDAPFKD